MVGALWAIYGLTAGFLSGVLEPVIDGFFHLVSNVGIVRVGGGYSATETLISRGHFQAAADAYAERARDKAPGRAMTELRRLIDRYPTAQGARRLRVALASLKFGAIWWHPPRVLIRLELEEKFAMV